MALPTDYYKIVEVRRAGDIPLDEFNREILQLVEEMNENVRHPGQEQWRIVSMTINCDDSPTFASADKTYSLLMQLYEG